MEFAFATELKGPFIRVVQQWFSVCCHGYYGNAAAGAVSQPQD